MGTDARSEAVEYYGLVEVQGLGALPCCVQGLAAGSLEVAEERAHGDGFCVWLAEAVCFGWMVPGASGVLWVDFAGGRLDVLLFLLRGMKGIRLVRFFRRGVVKEWDFRKF